MIYTSLMEIASFEPCATGWRKILKGQGKVEIDAVLFPLTAALESNSISDICWLLGKKKNKEICVRFAQMCADSVKHLKDSKGSHIDTYAYAAAYAAAYDAADAAAQAAVYDAAAAAAAYAAAADAAAAAAAYAAAYDAADAAAAYDAADAAAAYAAAADAQAAYAVAYAAADAAYDADAAAAQMNKNKEFMRQCLKDAS